MMYAEAYICVVGVYMDIGASKSGHHWENMAKRDSLFNSYWELTYIVRQCECNLIGMLSGGLTIHDTRP